MQLFKNTDAYPRVWTRLQDPRTQTTLILFPDDVIELDPEALGEGFDDAYLKPLSSEEEQAYRNAQAAAAAAVAAEEAKPAVKSKKGVEAPESPEAEAEPDAQKES